MFVPLGTTQIQYSQLSLHFKDSKLFIQCCFSSNYIFNFCLICVPFLNICEVAFSFVRKQVYVILKQLLYTTFSSFISIWSVCPQYQLMSILFLAYFEIHISLFIGQYYDFYDCVTKMLKYYVCHITSIIIIKNKRNGIFISLHKFMLIAYNVNLSEQFYIVNQSVVFLRNLFLNHPTFRFHN